MKIICTPFRTAAMVVISLLAGAAQAETFNFQTLNNSGDPVFNQLLGINNAGTIAGYFGDGGAGNPNQGYRRAPPSSYTGENFPGSTQTQVTGISNTGSPATTVGFYIAAGGDQFGFVDVGGTFTSVADPSTTLFNGITTDQLLGVNDGGIAAGFYLDNAGEAHAYLYNSGMDSFATVTLPVGFNALSTTATGVNNAGVIAGFFTDTGGATHGFIDDGGTFSQLDDPGGSDTMILGLNNEGQFVGSYVDGSGETQGFIYNVGSNSWQTISDPSASSSASFGITGTTVNGINDLGDLVGFYSDGRGTDGVNGFLATPVATPEPAGFLPALLVGLLIVSVRRLGIHAGR